VTAAVFCIFFRNILDIKPNIDAGLVFLGSARAYTNISFAPQKNYRILRHIRMSLLTIKIRILLFSKYSSVLLIVMGRERKGKL
jgi:hypothetical protein